MAAAPMLPANAADASITLSRIVEHPALNAYRNGLLKELEDAGYVVGKNLKFE